MKTEIYNFLENEASALAAGACDRFVREHPTASAALGTGGEGIYKRAVDAFLDVYVTEECDTWDKVVQELIQAGWADPYALVDLPLGLLRTVCDRLVEMGQSDATGIELDPQDLAAIEEAGASMACSLVKLTKPIRQLVLAPVERRAPVGRAAPRWLSHHGRRARPKRTSRRSRRPVAPGGARRSAGHELPRVRAVAGGRDRIR